MLDQNKPKWITGGAKQTNIDEYAREMGYDHAEKVGHWKNFDVYRPFFRGIGHGRSLGQPVRILVCGEMIRLASGAEITLYYRELCGDEFC